MHRLPHDCSLPDCSSSAGARSHPAPACAAASCPQEVQEQQAAQQRVEKLQERLEQWQGHTSSAKSALLLPVTHCPSIELSALLVLTAFTQQREQNSYVWRSWWLSSSPLTRAPRCRLLQIALMNLDGGIGVERIRAISQNKVQVGSRLSCLSSLTNHKYERQSLPFLCTFCLPLDYAKAEGGCKCGATFGWFCSWTRARKYWKQMFLGGYFFSWKLPIFPETLLTWNTDRTYWILSLALCRKYFSYPIKRNLPSAPQWGNDALLVFLHKERKAKQSNKKPHGLRNHLCFSP